MIEDKVIIIIKKDLFVKVIIKILKGANFCKVNNKDNVIQFNPSATSGNQEWTGANPSFIIKAVKNIYINEFVLKSKNSWFISRLMIEKSNNVDAKAWITKYFIEDSLA